jgi:YVTN family beta-propeller protein
MRNAIRRFAPNKSVPHHAGLLHHLSIVLFLLLPMGVGSGTATAQAQTRAYVTNNSSSTVSVIDTATSTVVATIPFGQLPFDIAITPDGTQAYVTPLGFNSAKTVSVVNIATNTVATILVGVNPLEVAITPDGTRAYVTNNFSDTFGRYEGDSDLYLVGLWQAAVRLVLRGYVSLAPALAWNPPSGYAEAFYCRKLVLRIDLIKFGSEDCIC